MRLDIHHTSLRACFFKRGDVIEDEELGTTSKKFPLSKNFLKRGTTGGFKLSRSGGENHDRNKAMETNYAPAKHSVI